jgi:hypothetical protein
MASVVIHHQWPDGSATRVRVKAASNYPDALNEAKATAVAAFREAFATFEDAEEEQ